MFEKCLLEARNKFGNQCDLSDLSPPKVSNSFIHIDMWV